MQGSVFSIEEFSVYDGPGIRTTVFLKGCPLRCTWCHNPEGQDVQNEILRSPNGCVHCGNCIKTAVHDGDRIYFSEESIRSCPQHLLRRVAESFDSAALCQRLLKNRDLLVGGGVTFSGGEPLMQSDFLFECLSLLAGKLHTAIQTSGFCSADVFARATALSDYFLYDLKLMDDEMHRRFTGVSNAPILENFDTLCKSGKPFTVRVPLIPGVTDTAKNLEAIAELLNENGVGSVELLPYNKMAGGKYKMLLREYSPLFDEQIPVNPRCEIFEAHMIKSTVL